MKIGLLIYGSLDTLSGGYMYDRMLLEYLRAHGDEVRMISLPWRNYAAHLMDNLTFKLPGGLDVLIQDELNHPSLINANRAPHPYPIVSLVHHLKCSELRPNWQNAFYRVFEKKYLQSVDGFIFNSKTTQAVVNSLAPHNKPELVAYPPTDRFGGALSEHEIRKRAQAREFKIVFLGNIIERKGLHTLLQALPRLKRESISVDVIGSMEADPFYARKMRKFVMDNDLPSRVTFHGALNHQPLAETLKRAHVLVVPSSYEGFGIVYLEGMGFGLPAIGTTAGAAGEVIENGKTGYLIEPADFDSLAAHLNALAEDRALLETLSLQARERYLQQPAWDQTAGRIREFLKDIIRTT